MPRPFIMRTIAHCPKVKYFKPVGIPANKLEVVEITFDELEAMRLNDLLGFYYEEAAKKMNISRQTFGIIIEKARKKVIDALINGKMIKIEGGVFKMAENRKFRCFRCGHEWGVPHGTGRPKRCPKCEDLNIHRDDEQKGCGRGMGRGFGRGCKRAIEKSEKET